MSVLVDRPGARLHVMDRPGDRQVVVLTHGAGMDSGTMAGIAADLHADGHRTITWDLRGHGQSPLSKGHRFRAADALDDLAAVIEARDVHRPILIGHSLGANLSQALVRRDPSRAAALIVIGATANAGPLTRVEEFALRRLSGPALALIPARRLPRLLAQASATTPAGIERVRAVFERMPKATFIDVWRATADLVAPEPDYRSPVPLALIRGAEDGTGNIARAMEAWALREGTTVDVIAGAGHVAMWDAPEATVDAVRRALAALS